MQATKNIQMLFVHIFLYVQRLAVSPGDEMVVWGPCKHRCAGAEDSIPVPLTQPSPHLFASLKFQINDSYF